MGLLSLLDTDGYIFITRQVGILGYHARQLQKELFCRTKERELLCFQALRLYCPACMLACVHCCFFLPLPLDNLNTRVGTHGFPLGRRTWTDDCINVIGSKEVVPAWWLGQSACSKGWAYS